MPKSGGPGIGSPAPKASPSLKKAVGSGPPSQFGDTKKAGGDAVKKTSPFGAKQAPAAASPFGSSAASGGMTELERVRNEERDERMRLEDESAELLRMKMQEDMSRMRMEEEANELERVRMQEEQERVRMQQEAQELERARAAEQQERLRMEQEAAELERVRAEQTNGGFSGNDYAYSSGASSSPPTMQPGRDNRQGRYQSYDRMQDPQDFFANQPPLSQGGFSSEQNDSLSMNDSQYSYNNIMQPRDKTYDRMGDPEDYFANSPPLSRGEFSSQQRESLSMNDSQYSYNNIMQPRDKTYSRMQDPQEYFANTPPLSRGEFSSEQRESLPMYDAQYSYNNIMQKRYDSVFDASNPYQPLSTQELQQEIAASERWHQQQQEGEGDDAWPEPQRLAPGDYSVDDNSQFTQYSQSERPISTIQNYQYPYKGRHPKDYERTNFEDRIDESDPLSLNSGNNFVVGRDQW